MRKFFTLFIASMIILAFAGCGGGGGGGADSFTISYNANGADSGSAPKNQISADKDLTIQDNSGNLAKSGYLFDGWNTAANGSGKDFTPGVSYKGDNLTLYAKWAAIFKVEELAPSPAPALVVVQKAPGSSALKILGLTARGRTLTAINIPAAIDGNTVTAIGSGAFQDCSHITNITVPATVTSIEGNAFAGCSSLSSLMLLGAVPPAFVASALDSCPATVYVPVSAVAAYQAADGWDANPGIIDGYSNEPHTVTFDSQGATTSAVPATKTVNPPAITVETLPAAPKKTGYNFGGWFTEPAGAGVPFTASTPVTSDMTVYAKWDSYSYTVSFDDQGATTPVSPASKTVDSPATTVGTLPSQPEKTGLIFGGWYTQTNGGGTQFTASTPVTDNITVYAYWVEYSYTVTFDDQGATTHVNPASKTVNSPATTVGSLPTPPQKTNFAFEGWYTQTGGAGSEFTAGTTVTGNITVYAKWNNAYSYTVTFNDHGATTSVNPSSKTVAYPATKIDALPTPPEKTGCLFVGWNTSEDGTGDEFTAGTTVSGNITVHAIWVSCSSVANNRTGAGIGDVVLSNRATVTLSNYSTYASKLTSAGFTPVGVVAYVGKTGVTGGGTPGKTYMVGLDQGNCKWAQEGTTGYLCEMITDLDKGEINWASIQSADPTGAANPAVRYPAFNYCNTYSAAGYTSGWFLPSYRELFRLNDNKTAINDALTAIGGIDAVLLDDFVWSSSNISGNTIVEYGFYFNTGNAGSLNKASVGGVRVVRALDD